MKNMKRISKVTIKRMIDGDPDTSYLGEYASRPTSEFSIDREHSLDCASQTYNVTVGGIRTLKHAINYLSEGDSINEDAIELLESTLDAIGECDCGESGDMGRNEYHYFNPSFNYVDKNGQARPENRRADVIKYVRQDYERMEGLQHGDWCYIGIRAEAEILIPSGSASLVQEITSGGLWGIESDSDKGYFTEVETEELAELRSQLSAIGFSKRAISGAIKNATRENE